MKTKAICVIFIGLIIVLVSIKLYKYPLEPCNISDEYFLYLANTNFPVVFEDGDWSEEFKEFVMTDLNCLYNTVEYNGLRKSNRF